MSPSRTRKPVAHLRSRSEIVVAIAVGVGIVAATAFLVWAMRPGTSTPGTGGMLSRQPRVTIFVILVGVLLAAGITWMLRGRRRPKRLDTRGAIALAVVVVTVVAIAAGIFWPGGLVHHWPPQPKTTPVTSPTPASNSVPATPAPTGTTEKGATTVPRTSVPATTIPPTTTPKA